MESEFEQLPIKPKLRDLVTKREALALGGLELRRCPRRVIGGGLRAPVRAGIGLQIAHHVLAGVARRAGRREAPGVVPDVELRVVAREALALVFEIARIDVTHEDSTKQNGAPMDAPVCFI
jgi:hypothetical protein